jgi:hypothetical protein
VESSASTDQSEDLSQVGPLGAARLPLSGESRALSSRANRLMASNRRGKRFGRASPPAYLDTQMRRLSQLLLHSVAGARYSYIRPRASPADLLILATQRSPSLL